MTKFIKEATQPCKNANNRAGLKIESLPNPNSNAKGEYYMGK